jgi:predicted nuclease of predicted toxin-antitoxin system
VKVLLDTCVWGGAALALRQAGHDMIWAGDWGDDPGDDAILARAHDEARILVTLDKDFGELVVVRGAAHSGIVRVVNTSARQQANAILQVLGRYAAELSKGALVTVEPGRVRIRLVPDDDSEGP